jgi:Uma2 family endonuclease
MNVQLPVEMDKSSFLAWVQGREGRYELDRGRVVMMTGGSRAHWQITGNLFRALDRRLDRDRWSVGPEFGIDLETGSIRYPDIVVDIAGQTPKDLTAAAPVLIAEVLSPSTERVDLGDKAAEYLGLPTLAVYLVLAQDEMKAWVWTRTTQGFRAGPDVLEGENAVVSIPELQIELTLKEIYDRVRFA